MKKTFYLLTFFLTSLIVSCSSDDDPTPLPVVVAPEVVVPDTGNPTITLVGSTTINIEEGDSYTDAGASASDEVDGDLSSSITTSGSVDTSTPGTYRLTYSVSDAAGNSVELTRTVIVIAASVKSVITELEATGTVSEQTPAEAKKTIYGKWNFPDSAKSFNGFKSNVCAFDFIEFTDNDYFMSLLLEGETVVTYGSYVLNEDAAGNVSSVELKFNTGSSDITIATLTNIVVIESEDELSATFTVDLNIPEEASFEACNSLAGEYTDIGKDEPMEESYDAVENSSTSTSTANSSNTISNHVKLVNNIWILDSVESGSEDVFNIETVFEEFCYEDICDDQGICNYTLIPDCTNPNSLILQFSAFGSYSFIYLGSNQGTKVENDTWAWSGDGQKSFYVGYINGNYEEVITIISLTESTLVVTNDSNDRFTFLAQ